MIRKIAGIAIAAGILGAAVLLSPSAGAAAGPPECTTTDLSIKSKAGGAGMSQPSIYVTIRNTKTTDCFVKGYPVIANAYSKAGEQQIKVTNGNIMNAPAAKPQTIVLGPGKQAWFALGASTASGSKMTTLTSFWFKPSKNEAASTPGLPIYGSLQASAPKGKPFPLTVTAYMPGAAK